jgi:hypothetical protein
MGPALVGDDATRDLIANAGSQMTKALAKDDQVEI